MTTERWKCPDCKGWVRDDVEVHKCEAEAIAPSPFAPSPYTYTGHACLRCGMWVTTGNYHACWTYTGNPPNTPYIVYTTSTGNTTANLKIIATNTPIQDDDDGSAGVAV
jgi:hypothetical protein